jgi:hypothetical protein
MQDDWLVVYERNKTFHIAWGDMINKPTVTGDCEATTVGVFQRMVKDFNAQYEQGLNAQALRVTGKLRATLDKEMQQYIDEQIEQRR